MLGIAAMILAFGTLSCAMAWGGDVGLIVVGLVFAAASMGLFEQADPWKEDR
jgi:hypothetical protein